MKDAEPAFLILHPSSLAPAEPRALIGHPLKSLSRYGDEHWRRSRQRYPKPDLLGSALSSLQAGQRPGENIPSAALALASGSPDNHTSSVGRYGTICLDRLLREGYTFV